MTATLTQERVVDGARGRPIARRIEWPTVALAAATYGAFGLVTWHHAALPWWLLLPLGGYLVCLHGSLQHEAVHGHPTRWDAVNELLVYPSLWLWMPYRVYRETHLSHHRKDYLTDPLADSESYYVAPEDWAHRGTWRRAFDWAHNALLGRLLLGPLVCVAKTACSAIRNIVAGDLHELRAWCFHAGAVAVVLVWILGFCDMPMLTYLGFFAYPGIALTLLRSYLEHRAAEAVGERSVLVEAGPVASLLYLNNNLHALHHAEPALAWYRLPARYREVRDSLLEQNGNYRYRGYLEVWARYLLWAKEPPVHPFYHSPAFAKLRIANDSSQPPDSRVA